MAAATVDPPRHQWSLLRSITHWLTWTEFISTFTLSCLSAFKSCSHRFHTPFLVNCSVFFSLWPCYFIYWCRTVASLPQFLFFSGKVYGDVATLQATAAADIGHGGQADRQWRQAVWSSIGSSSINCRGSCYFLVIVCCCAKCLCDSHDSYQLFCQVSIWLFCWGRVGFVGGVWFFAFLYLFGFLLWRFLFSMGESLLLFDVNVGCVPSCGVGGDFAGKLFRWTAWVFVVGGGFVERGRVAWFI